MNPFYVVLKVTPSEELEEDVTPDEIADDIVGSVASNWAWNEGKVELYDVLEKKP